MLQQTNIHTMNIASGYDTFSLRKENDEVSVFELDLPELIADKLERIKKIETEADIDTVFVPCDLADTDWKEKMLQSGYVPEKKAFGSLLGISYYLDKPEFQSLLQTVSELMVEGSVICFDYPSEEEGRESKTNRQLAAGAGEQMKAMYSELEIKEILSGCGFEISTHLNHEELTKQYFSAYNQYNEANVMKAPVGVGYISAKRKAKIRNE